MTGQIARGRVVRRAASPTAMECLEERWLLSAPPLRLSSEQSGSSLSQAILSSLSSHGHHHQKVIVGTPVGGDTTPAPFVDTVSSMEARDAATVTPGGANIDDGAEGGDDDDGGADLRRIRRDKQDFDGSVLGQPGTPEAPQQVGDNFAAVSLQDQFNSFGTGSIPPDTMGAIGPNHFLEVINSSVAIFNRSGARLSIVTLNSFFAVNVGGTNFPRGGAFDPRVLYDRRSGRWFASALEFGVNTQQNGIVLAVSRSSDPTGTWDKYFLDVGVAQAGSTTFFTDYDTLGVDDNGVYLGMTIFPSTGGGSGKIVATPKASLIAGSPSLGTVFQFSNITDMFSSPQPAYDFDAVAANGREWFVSSSTTFLGNVNYRTLTWSGGVPSLTANAIAVATPGYGNNGSLAGGNVNFTPSGSTTPIDTGDDRLLMAIIRNGQLWTTRTVSVDSNGTDTGAIDRVAAEWIDLNVTGANATLTQSGRVFDSSGAPRHYIYPSVMANGLGQMAMGFSGGKSAEFMGAYTTGRLPSDPLGTTEAIVQLKAGQASYTRNDNSGRNRWGDYSYTSLDPNDDLSMWTIQEYASNAGANIWGTYVADLQAPPPTLNNPAASAVQGQSAVVLNLTGTGFYDPGPGFVDRLQVELTGGSPNGITITNLQYNSPTSITVTLDVASNAALGSRNITVTNPDGGAALVLGGFNVTPARVFTGTISDDDYLLRMDPGIPGNVEVLLGGVSEFTGPKASTPSIIFNLDGGDDSLTIDYTNGDPIPSVGVFYDGGPGNDSLIINGSAAADVTTLTNPVIAAGNGRINLNDPSNGGETVESITYNGNAGSDTLNLVSSPLAPLTFHGGVAVGTQDTLNIGGGGPHIINGDLGAQSSAVNLNVVGVSTNVFLSATQHLNALSITNGNVILAQNGNRVINTNSLSFPNSTGTLNLTDNDLIVQNGALGTWNGSVYTGISGMVASGRNGGQWNGPGIITSSATPGSNFTTLAVASASQILGLAITQTGTFDGQTVTGSSVLVKYTYGGDANLDGRINIDDYGRIDGNVGLSGSVFTWFNGDFNYDGKINIDDYGIIDGNIGVQGPPL